MPSIKVILLVLASICWFLAAIDAPSKPVNLTALGLLFWSLTWYL